MTFGKLSLGITEVLCIETVFGEVRGDLKTQKRIRIGYKTINNYTINLQYCNIKI